MCFPSLSFPCYSFFSRNKLITTIRGWSPFLDVPQQDQGCRLIVRSPADTSETGCGKIIAAFQQPACATVNLEKTFMVQKCCGDECKDAGVSSKRWFPMGGSVFARSPGGSGFSYTFDDVEPVQVGQPPELRQSTSRAAQSNKVRYIAPRDGNCEKGSWEEDDEQYTKPADGIQIVSEGPALTGPATAQITKERTQSFTTSMNLGIADILSFGMGMEVTESMTNSKSSSFDIPAGQTGRVGWTAYLRCTKGTFPGKLYGNLSNTNFF